MIPAAPQLERTEASPPGIPNSNSPDPHPASHPAPAPTQPANPGQRALVLFATSAAALAMAAGVLVLTGWALDIPALKSVLPGWVSMKPNTALGFILAGAALLGSFVPPSATAQPAARLLRRWARPGAWLTGLIGLLTLAEYFFDWNPGLDQWLFHEAAGTIGTSHPGRMAPDSASCFVLLALGWELAFRARPTRRHLAGQATLGALVVTLALAAILSYAASDLRTNGWWDLTMMAVPTGVLFALLGTALLLNAWRESRFATSPPAEAGSSPERSAAVASLLMLLLPATGIIAIGMVTYRGFDRHHRLQVEQELSTIADLKVAQIVQWRQERLADATYLHRTPYAARRALDVLRAPDSGTTREMFTSWLASLFGGGTYQRTLLLDEQLNVRLAFPATPPPTATGILCEAARPAAEEALKSRQVVFADLHRNTPHGPVHLSLMVPLVVHRENEREVVPAAGREPSPSDRSAALLVLEIDAEKYLDPLLRSWTAPSRSGETLLVRREGAEVVYLNELRHRTNTALNLRRPLTNTLLPAAQGIRGTNGVLPGRDYRDVPVLAAVRPVPGSPWSLVAKVDLAEIDGPLWERFWMTMTLVTALLVAAGAGVGILWRQQGVRFYRKLADSAEVLRTSELRYRRLFESAKDGILIVNANTGKIDDANPSLAGMLGVPREDLVGRILGELPYFREIAPDSSRLASLPGNEGLHRDHHALLPRDGRRIEVELVSTIYPVNRHRVIQHRLRDITERKRSETALRRSEARYRRLHESMTDAFAATDLAGRILEFNPAFRALLGFPDAELLRQTIQDLTPARWHGLESRIIAEQVLPRGYSDVYEKEYRRADGTVIPVELRTYLIRDDQDEPAGLWAIVRDISDRKRAEAQLRKLARAVEQSPVSIVITDRAGTIEFVNPKFTQATGYTAEEALGKNPRLLKSGETSPEEYRMLWETITAGGEWRGEFHNRRKDGTLYWESASISGIRDASGEITHFIAVKEDVTDRRLAESRLLRAQRLDSIGSLASGIAHDLNNILTPILLISPLLQDLEDPASRRELAQTIETSTLRAVDIVNQLLGFARGRDGKKTPVQVRHLIREMAKLARETFPRNIQIEEDCATDLWPVLADATQLHQVLLNLCINARDAMPSGGRLILRAANDLLDEHYVLMRKEAKPGPHVRIEVEDTGTGIPDALRERIFESFFTSKAEGRGTGLGLTTVQGIVKDHLGLIGFTSRPGKGTTFQIHLPAASELPSGAQPAPILPPPSPGHGELVLVVDDELAILDATRRTLEQHGYTVLRARDGIEALACHATHSQQLRVVVTDVMMPMMDGVTLCRTLRRVGPGLPIIVSSGGLFDQAGNATLDALRALGIEHILSKPHSADILLRTLDEVLHP